MARKKKSLVARLQKFRQLEFLIAGGSVVIFAFLVAAFFLRPGVQPRLAEWNVSLSINNGAAFTNTPDVLLRLSSAMADRCSYANSDGIWTDYEPPTAEARQWTLSPGDGVKTVRVACVSADGGERSAEASILLDSTPPRVDILKPYGVTGSEFEVAFNVTDNLSRAVTCSLNLDSIEIGLGGVASGSVKVKTLTASPGAHSIRVECVDDAGNRGEGTVSFAVAQNANGS